MPVLMSFGMFRINVVMVCVRLAVCALSLFFMMQHPEEGQYAKVAAQAWLLAEVSMVAMLAIVLTKKRYYVQ